MRFQTPQFIEVEDKIFGPLTLKQFIYLAGTAGAVFLLYSFVPTFIAILIALPLVGLGLALAFYKVNNKSFIGVIESAFKYYIGSKLYIWKHEEEKQVAKKEVPKEDTILSVPTLSQSKLKDLAWSLDIQERQKEEPENSRENTATGSDTSEIDEERGLAE